MDNGIDIEQTMEVKDCIEKKLPDKIGNVTINLLYVLSAIHNAAVLGNIKLTKNYTNILLNAKSKVIEHKKR